MEVKGENRMKTGVLLTITLIFVLASSVQTNPYCYSGGYSLVDSDFMETQLATLEFDQNIDDHEASEVILNQTLNFVEKDQT